MNRIEGVVADPGGTVSLTFHRNGFIVQRVDEVTRTELFSQKYVFKVGTWTGLIVGPLLAIAGLVCYLAGSDTAGRRLLVVAGIYVVLSLLCGLCRIDYFGFLGWLPDPMWLVTITLCAPVFLLPPVFNGADKTRQERVGPAIQVHANSVVEAIGGHRDKHVWVRMHFTNGQQVTYWVKASHGQRILELTRELTQGRIRYWPEPSR